MTGASMIFVRVIWDAHVVKLPLALPGARMIELHVQPEPSHPFGRKGLTLASAWTQLAKPEHAGLLILDGDVAVDPWDVLMMMAAVNLEPAAVHVAPAKIWQATTGSDQLWTWGHWRDQRGQEWTEEPQWFAFNFTYLPRKLIELAITKGLRSKQFPQVDMWVSEVAQKAGIPVRVVKDCAPKHMHY